MCLAFLEDQVLDLGRVDRLDAALDQCLADLVRRNVVSATEARMKAQNKDNFAA